MLMALRLEEMARERFTKINSVASVWLGRSGSRLAFVPVN